MFATYFPGTSYSNNYPRDNSEETAGDLVIRITLVLGLATSPIWLPALAIKGVALAAANPKLTIDVLAALAKTVLLGTSPLAAVAEFGIEQAKGPLIEWLTELVKNSK